MKFIDCSNHECKKSNFGFTKGSAFVFPQCQNIKEGRMIILFRIALDVLNKLRCLYDYLQQQMVCFCSNNIIKNGENSISCNYFLLRFIDYLPQQQKVYSLFHCKNICTLECYIYIWPKLIDKRCIPIFDRNKDTYDTTILTLFIDTN